MDSLGLTVKTKPFRQLHFLQEAFFIIDIRQKRHHERQYPQRAPRAALRSGGNSVCHRPGRCPYPSHNQMLPAIATGVV